MTEITIATWNINSVRLRIRQVGRFLRKRAPDILCLQETKCLNELFPAKDFRKFGYPHLAVHGQKSYNGVAIVSRLPFESLPAMALAGKDDRRHVAVRLQPNGAAPLDLHNFYVPAGGDVPDASANDKFAHKLAFLGDLRAAFEGGAGASRRVLVGDLNVAPLEHDVWSHRQMLDVVSHTPAECDLMRAAQGAGRWVDATRRLRPEPEKVYSWWSYRAKDWATSDRGRRLDHAWVSESLAPAIAGIDIVKATRGWQQPSDHVPVVVTLDLDKAA